VELYAEAFEQAGALDRLEAFSSHYGADFYRMARNQDTLTLRKEPWIAPQAYPFGDAKLTPLRAGETLQWRLIE
jgi:dihydroorotase